MAMMRNPNPPTDPDAYIAELDGWRRQLVELLRRAVVQAAGFEERIKWGHLVYFANGPALLIRAEESRVLFGFWRGKRLTKLESRLKPGGKYEMATIEFREGDSIAPETAVRLASEAAALNFEFGDPTRDAGKCKK